MANTLNLGTDGNWGTKDGSVLAYNSENGIYKPLPFSFDRVTSATRVNKEGLIETVSNNEPRVDYKDDSKGALLLEKIRSNLITYSEDFSQWSIISSGIVITDNTNEVLSPSGKNDATKVEFNVASKILGQSPTLSGNYSGFVYVKGTQGETIRFNFGGTEENFTLTGGWDKLERTNITATANAFNLNTFGGATARTIYVWGTQLEQGSYATSYIPTQGSAVTRGSDNVVFFSPNHWQQQGGIPYIEASGDSSFPDMFNGLEGVLFLEMKPNALDGVKKLITLSSGYMTDRIMLGYDTDNTFIASVYNDGGYQAVLGGQSSFIGNRDIGEFNKIAISYKNNEFKLFVNGTKESEDTNGTVFGANTLKTFRFSGVGGSNRFYGEIRQIQYIDKSLTDAELQALTS